MTSDYPVEHIQHLDGAAEFLPITHRSKAGRWLMIRGIAAVFQELEDQVYDTYISRALPNATGTTLDFYGWLAGVPRTGLVDLWYRPLIETSFMTKRCTGSVNEIIEIWRTGTRAEYVEFTRYKKNVLVLTCWRTEWLPEGYAKRLAEVVRRGCPIGVVVLLEAKLPFLGGSERTYAPLPASSPLNATGAKVW